MPAVAVSPFVQPALADWAVRSGLWVTCRPAQGAAEQALHLEIRRRVFVEEQAFFEGTDRDAHDDDPATIHVLGLCGDVAGGVVRLYPLDGGLGGVAAPQRAAARGARSANPPKSDGGLGGGAAPQRAAARGARAANPPKSEGEAGLWKGDRLAVLPAFRSNGVGAPLVRFAVLTAAEAGGRRMVAHIQLANVGFFERLGWYPVGEPVSFVGHPHQMMAIDLPPVLRRV